MTEAEALETIIAIRRRNHAYLFAISETPGEKARVQRYCRRVRRFGFLDPDRLRAWVWRQHTGQKGLPTPNALPDNEVWWVR